ncbi:MAG: hypothetical protein WCK11_00310 [Candidatus Falkowbacteria bacterium]
MEKRGEKILLALIKEHIKSGQPVGSEVLVNKYKLGVSSATVRNELSALEEGGMIMQPHTSAGRVPTEAAYRFYLEKNKARKLTDTEEQQLNALLTDTEEQNLKQLAKTVAQQSGLAVIWAFHRHNLYYTGIANFLSQPEFNQPNVIYDISGIIDRMDEVIDQVFDEISFTPEILLGSANPFSPVCATVISKYRHGNHTGLVGILGPMRMCYERNLAIVEYLSQKLNSPII